MFRILIDTCVWLDIAKDQKQLPVLDVLEQMIYRKQVSLIVPRIVLDEFKRNRNRVAQESKRSLASHFQMVRRAVDKAGGDKRKVKAVISHLEDVNHKIPLIGGVADETLDRIEKLLNHSEVIEVTPEIMSKAGMRAIKKIAPFHRDKNSMADAVVVETYSRCLAETRVRGTRFALVTHNKHDFSAVDGNQKLVHPDLAYLFTRVRSLYFINLAEALNRVDSTLISQHMIEESWLNEPRSLSEIKQAEERLETQVWYDRHCMFKRSVETGRHKIVERKDYDINKRGTTPRDIWEGAIASGKAVERKFGGRDLGPWDDMEWGMINGKLSALRWVLGEEWDMLDT